MPQEFEDRFRHEINDRHNQILLLQHEVDTLTHAARILGITLDNPPIARVIIAPHVWEVEESAEDDLPPSPQLEDAGEPEEAMLARIAAFNGHRSITNALRVITKQDGGHLNIPLSTQAFLRSTHAEAGDDQKSVGKRLNDLATVSKEWIRVRTGLYEYNERWYALENDQHCPHCNGLLQHVEEIDGMGNNETALKCTECSRVPVVA